jgi:hypothetical protein
MCWKSVVAQVKIAFSFSVAWNSLQEIKDLYVQSSFLLGRAWSAVRQTTLAIEAS